MSNEVVQPIAGGKESPVAQELSADAFTRQRIERRTPKEAKPAEPAPEVVPEEVKPETKEDPAETTKEAPKDKEALSQIDLENMSEADLRELSEKLGSRAVARFGELTAKRKHAEEQLAALQAQLAQQNVPDPLASSAPRENPYSNIRTLVELQAKAKEVDEVVDWAEDVLWNNDQMAAEDVVAIVDGKELTKQKVRKALKDAQKARKDYLPAQAREVQAIEQRQALKGQLQNAARTELDWMQGEDNETRKQYDLLSKSPLLEKAIKAVPDLEPYLDYMVAHAANSIYGRKTVPLVAPPSKQINPPSSPASSAAKTEQPEGRTQRAEKDLSKKFSDSGDKNDYIALRTAQISQRQRRSL